MTKTDYFILSVGYDNPNKIKQYKFLNNLNILLINFSEDIDLTEYNQT